MSISRKTYFISMAIALLSGIILVVINIQGIAWALIALSALLFFLGTRSYYESKSDIKNKFTKEINNYITKQGIKFDKTYFSESNKLNVSFSHDEGILYIFNYLPSFNKTLIDYKDILESNLIENGETTVTETKRGSQIGGMLVGGTLLGSGGAIVGGLSGKKSSSTMINKMELKIVLNDLNNPVVTIPIKDTDEEISKSSSTYKELYDKAYEIHKTISVIIKHEVDKQVQ
ncbi:hypothetical protein CHH83_02715 [Bacillus sp. 7586-K]|nr:hypothetical protein CHH83_02715 [Bacillus sp. 7586-K]